MGISGSGKGETGLKYSGLKSRVDDEGERKRQKEEN